ncbi:hypothetical protein DY000_02060747 [Brassica cretica]|uniref:Uncharacterized protein n=1 Tax=Brassica cretica TaxID=69181 RepID=A0ABQ7B329_BRACR|nr:hypothetical protein DY000_02060747 [Brassica cretica]
MTHSFLERIGQQEVDLANDREESVPFNVLDATFIIEFSSSQMFSMLFRDSLDPGQDDATMAEPDDSSTKDKPGWINGIARDDQEVPRMIRKTCQVMRFWRQIEAREEGW